MVPGIYALAAALILINGLYTAPGPTGAGALVILAGIPLYLLFRAGPDLRSGYRGEPPAPATR